MSLYSYTKKPDWNNDGLRPNHVNTNVFATPQGWVGPMPGENPIAITSMTWSGGVVTVVATAHGLVNGQDILITGVTPSGYNGYVSSITYIDANTFSFALASDPGTVTVHGVVHLRGEVMVCIRDLLNKILAASDAAVLPTFTAAVKFTGTAVTGGTVNTITGGALGSGYPISSTTIPVTITGGLTSDGVAATAQATSNGSGQITSVTVLTPGSGYISEPTITIGGGGTGSTGWVANLVNLHAVTGTIMNITLTPSEPVQVSGTPTISVVIGSNTRIFTFDALQSTSTSLEFEYAMVAGDVATAGQVTSGASVDISGTYSGIGDILAATNAINWLTSVTFSAPSLTNVIVN